MLVPRAPLDFVVDNNFSMQSYINPIFFSSEHYFKPILHSRYLCQARLIFPYFLFQVYSLFYLNSLQSCFLALIPSIDKPAQVRSSSATLKIIFLLILEPDNITACGNIISDISDHFSQFCILKSAWDKTKTRNL